MNIDLSVPAPADDLRASAPRLSKADLIVILGGALLLLAGWFLKTWHDARMVPAEAGGIALQRPADWFPLPAADPAIAQWIAPDGSAATLTVYAAPISGGGATTTLGSLINPATSRPAFSPLGSVATIVGGREAVESEYAYARNSPSDPAPPVVIHGREVSWIDGERQVVLALEAPEPSWGAVERFYPAVIASIGDR